VPMSIRSRWWLLLFALLAVWAGWVLQLPPRLGTWLVFASGAPLLAAGSWLLAADRKEAWRTFLVRTADYHVVWCVLLLALAVQIEDAHGVTTDGVIYFTQLRSVIFDRDLDITREFVYLQQPARPVHIVPIGPVLVWLPLYLMVAVADAIGRIVGWWPAPADAVAIGLTTPYVRAALVSSFVIGAVGVLVVHRLLRREFSRLAALAATLLVFGGTSLFWYMVYEPSMTHAASFGLVALFVAAVARCDPRTATARQLASIGFLLGLAFITRPQEAVFALLPAIQVLALSFDSHALAQDQLALPSARLKVAGRYALWGFIGFAPLLALQLAHSAILFSREWLVLVGGAEAFLSPLASRWADTLWSSWHGFFSWTPVAYVALFGTIAYARRRWWWAVAAALILFTAAWINGATPDLGSGWSFGGRRFVSCLVVLAPGLAFIMQALLARPATAIAILAVVAIGWNYLLMEQYRSGMLPRDRAVSFAEMTRQQAEVYTRPPYFYPFAFPANAVFAWRTELPIDRYDLLGVEPPRAAVDLAMEGRAGRFLLDGWGPLTGDTTGTAWWTAGSPATLTLPLRLPPDHAVRLTIDARSRLTSPEVRASMTVLVNNHPVGSFVAETEQPTSAVFTTSRAAWIDGFNRISLVTAEPFWPVAVYRIAVTPIESP
jgi:hypothetical protein